MTVEIYNMISMVGYGLSAVMALVSVILFIKLEIPKLIGELNGSTARREIAAIEEQNSSGRSESRRPGRVKTTDTKVTSKITPTDTMPIAESNPAEDTAVLLNAQIPTIQGAGDDNELVFDDIIILIQTEEIIV